MTRTVLVIDNRLVYGVRMPSRNSLKELVPDGIYHVYNRGVEKRNIFLEASDYHTFINRLDQTLSDPNSLTTKRTRGRKGGDRLRNYNGEVQVLAYCLMPNHYHLLVKQLTEDGLPKFMSTLSTSYSMYFNRKYSRVGSLFQGRYKAALVGDDQYYAHISRYIHLNPIDIDKTYATYPYSSYLAYTKNLTPDWLRTDDILELFDGDRHAYAEFVADWADRFHILEELLTLD